MYSKQEKAKENRSRAVANDVAQKKSGKKQNLRFSDNKQTIASQRMIEVIQNESRENNSLALQMKKKHHRPTKKKYLSKNIGRKQEWISARALELIRGGMSRPDARRQATEEWNAQN